MPKSSRKRKTGRVHELPGVRKAKLSLQQTRRKTEQRQAALVRKVGPWLAGWAKDGVVHPDVRIWPVIEKDAVALVCEVKIDPPIEGINIQPIDTPGTYAACASCKRRSVMKGKPLPHRDAEFMLFNVGTDLKPKDLHAVHVSLFLCVTCGGPGSIWWSKLIEAGAVTANLTVTTHAVQAFHSAKGLVQCPGCDLDRAVIGWELTGAGIDLRKVDREATSVLRCKGCQREETISTEFLRQYTIVRARLKVRLPDGEQESAVGDAKAELLRSIDLPALGWREENGQAVA